MERPHWLPLLGFLLVLHANILVPAEADVQSLDQGAGFDFAPNMISLSSKEPRDKAPEQSQPKVVAPSRVQEVAQSSSATNPLQRFVGSLVAQKATVREKQHLKHVSERLDKNKVMEDQKEQAEAKQLASEQQKGAQMAHQIAQLKAKTAQQKMKIHKEMQSKQAGVVRTDQAVAAKASERVTKLAAGVNVPNAPPIAKGQAPPTKATSSIKKGFAAPPANGISDGDYSLDSQKAAVPNVPDVNKKVAHLLEQQRAESPSKQVRGYDVAAAETRAEVEDEEQTSTLASDLGQGNDHSGTHITEATAVATAPSQGTVFIKESVLEDAAAKAELNLYNKEAQKQAVAAENMSDETAHVEAGEMSRITQVVAQAAANFINKQHEERARRPLASLGEVSLLDISPADSYLTASIAKMKTLHAAILKSTSTKYGAIQSATHAIAMLSAELSRVATGQRSVQESDHNVLRMSQRELGEAQAKGSDQSQDLGESAGITLSVSDDDDSSQDLGESATIDRTALEKSVATQVGLDGMSQQESDIEKEINGLGAEEAHLEDAAHRRVEAKKESAQKDEKKKEAEAQFLARKKEAMKKARTHDATLLAEESRLRMTTLSQVEAEAHLAAALAAKRKHQAEAVKNQKPIQQMDAQAQNREMYKRMYLENAVEQQAQAKTDLKNQLQDLKQNDQMHLKDALRTIKDHKSDLRHSMSEVSQLRESFEQDQELGESLQTTSSLELMKKSNNAAQFDLDAEHEVNVEARTILSKLQAIQRTDMGFANLAKNVLKEDFSGQDPKGTDPSLTSSAASLSMQLHISLVKFNHVNERAAQLESSVHRLLDLVGKATSHESSGAVHIHKAQQELARMSSSVKREESELELSQDDDDEDLELGESSSVAKPVPPMQAQLNWERQKLIDAQSGIQQVKIDTPRLVAMQTHHDQEKDSKVLGKANMGLASMQKQFKESLADVSPLLKNQQQLEQKLQEEQDRRDQYTQELAYVKRHVSSANDDMHHASHEIQSATDELRENVSN